MSDSFLKMLVIKNKFEWLMYLTKMCYMYVIMRLVFISLLLKIFILFSEINRSMIGEMSRVQF